MIYYMLNHIPIFPTGTLNIKNYLPLVLKRNFPGSKYRYEYEYKYLLFICFTLEAV